MFTQNAISSDSSIASVFKLAEAKGYELPEVVITAPKADSEPCYYFESLTGNFIRGEVVTCDDETSGNGCTAHSCS